ncbi:aldehyde oxidase GLOX1-like protein [Tanacetum coccineum]
MFGTEGRFEASGSFVDRLSISVTNLVTSRKAKVKRWMFKGVEAFSHVNFDEYICVALLEGLLIAGKEDLTYFETLYGWVIGFDEVLVAESTMTKISKLKRWSKEGDLNKREWRCLSQYQDVVQDTLYRKSPNSAFSLLELLGWRAVEPPSGKIVEFWRLLLFGANLIPHRVSNPCTLHGARAVVNDYLDHGNRGNSVGGYWSLRRAVMGSISPNSMFTNVLYPTELSLEAFSPSYLDSGSSSVRPRIISPKTKTKIHFGKRVAITFTVTGAVDPNGVSVTMVSPAFNTHSFSMNQRLLVLDSGNSTRSVEKS